MNSQKKHLIFCHKKVGSLDFFLPSGAIDKEIKTTVFVIYDLYIWFIHNNSKHLKDIYQKNNCTVEFKLGSLYGNKGYINNSFYLRIINFFLFLCFKLKIKKSNFFITLLDHLLINKRRINKSLNFKGLIDEKSKIWFEWSKTANVAKSIFESLIKMKYEINFLPDATIVQNYHTISENIKSLNYKKMIFHLPDISQIKKFNEDYPEYIKNTFFLRPGYTINKWEELYQKNHKMITNKGITIDILFIAQKTTTKNTKDDNIQFIDKLEHRKNIKEVVSVVDKLGINKKIIFHYRPHPGLAKEDDLKWVKDYIEKHHILFKDCSNVCIWDTIYTVDVLLSEFTTAFLNASIIDKKYMIRNHSFDFFYEFKAIRSAYKRFLDNNEIIYQSDLNKVLEAKLKIYETVHY